MAFEGERGKKSVPLLDSPSSKLNHFFLKIAKSLLPFVKCNQISHIYLYYCHKRSTKNTTRMKKMITYYLLSFPLRKSGYEKREIPRYSQLSVGENIL